MKKEYLKLLININIIITNLLTNNIKTHSKEIKGCPIILNKNPIFYIYDKVYKKENNCKERAKIIEDRLKTITKDLSIKTNDIKVEEWENTTKIIYKSGTIVTLTKIDIETPGVSIKDKKKLAKEYKEKIKKAITKEREDTIKRKNTIIDLEKPTKKNKKQKNSYIIITIITIITIHIISLLTFVHFIKTYKKSIYTILKFTKKEKQK